MKRLLIFVLLLGMKQDMYSWPSFLKKVWHKAKNTAAKVTHTVVHSNVAKDVGHAASDVGKAAKNMVHGNMHAAGHNLAGAGTSTLHSLQDSLDDAAKGISTAFNDTALKAIRHSYGNYPYKNDVAHVRLPHTALPEDLQTFEKNRKGIVKAKLLEKFGIACHEDAVPRIGFCLSGGGFRAMLSGLGFLSGAHKIGLYDCAMYNAGLSGGTWALGPSTWMLVEKGMNVESYKDTLVGHIDHGIQLKPGMIGPPFVEYPESNRVANNYVKRFAWDQTITAIDLWGALVGNLILQGVDGWDIAKEGERLDVRFTQLAEKVKNGLVPLPMLSAAYPFKSVQANNVTGYRWFAMNPFEAGTVDVGGYTPMWALGREFNNGTTVSNFKGHSPEYPLSYWLGTCGSAFEIDLKFHYGNNVPSLKIGKMKISIPKDLLDDRFMPCKIDNYLKGVRGSRIAGDAFNLIDAGINFNLPMPLLLKPEAQASDIIFMFDASATLFKPAGYTDPVLGDLSHKSLQLSLLNSYNEKMNKGVMPHFDASKVYDMYQHGKVVAVFNDPRDASYNQNLPVCFYFPIIKNPAYKSIQIGSTSTNDPEVIKKAKGDDNFISTYNFKYSKEQATWLSGLTEANIVSVKDEIKAVVKAWVQKNPNSYHIA